MEKRTMLIAIILIALVALIGFNFEKITGAATEECIIPEVKVYKTGFPEQNEVKAGEKITVQTKVMGCCVDPGVDFYFSGTTYAGEKKPASVRQAEVEFKGHYKLCKGDAGLDDRNRFEVGYRTDLDWDGDYYARVTYWKDRKTKDYVNAYFKVKPKEE